MKRKAQRGHTLIEAMFAAFLALVCALIFSATVPVANLTRGKAENLNQATSLAQKTLESIRGGKYPNASVSQLFADGKIQSTTAVNLGSLPGVGTAGEMAHEFTTVDVADVDSPGSVLPGGRGFIVSEQVNLDMRRITVIVAWQERSQWKSIRLMTLVANL